MVPLAHCIAKAAGANVIAMFLLSISLVNGSRIPQFIMSDNDEAIAAGIGRAWDGTSTHYLCSWHFKKALYEPQVISDGLRIMMIGRFLY